MKTLFAALLISAGLAGLNADAEARPGFGGGMGPAHGGLDHLDVIADQIGLTEAQEDEINALINEAQLESAVDRERMRQLREELQRLGESETGFDEQAATGLAEELGELVTRSAVSVAELRWRVRQVFTPEQRQQLEQFKAERSMRMPGWFTQGSGE